MVGYRADVSPLDMIVLGGIAYAGKSALPPSFPPSLLPSLPPSVLPQCLHLVRMMAPLLLLFLYPSHLPPLPPSLPPLPSSPALNIIKNQAGGSQWEGMDETAPSSLGNGVTVLKIQVREGRR